MSLVRRQFLRLAAGALAAPAVSRQVWSQAYPARPVRIIVGWPAGGVADIVARLTGQWLSERLGQPFVIENRVGAATNIATEAVVRAPADGHTLLLATAANAVNATYYEKLNFNFINDIAPVASIVDFEPGHGGQPVVSGQDGSRVHRLCQGEPRQGQHGIGRQRQSEPIAGELFKMMTGVDMFHVPYRGDPPAITDLVGGQVQVYFGTMGGSIEHIRAGKLRPLAVTSATRLQVLPDVPTMGDFLPGYEASSWQGLVAPRNTPAEIVDALNKLINAALVDPRMTARFAELGVTVLPGSPADFGKLIAGDIEKWARVVKFAGIKSD